MQPVLNLLDITVASNTDDCHASEWTALTLSHDTTNFHTFKCPHAPPLPGRTPLAEAAKVAFTQASRADDTTAFHVRIADGQDLDSKAVYTASRAEPAPSDVCES
eukprot:6194261-Pleurochrysis_carterae.AAC.2